MSIVEKAADRLRQTDREKLHSVGPRPAFGEGAGRPKDDPQIASDPSSPEREAVSDVVALDLDALRRAGLAPLQSMAQQLGREYQRIKRPLLAGMEAARLGAGPVTNNRLMITSATSGEGKTFTSFNLACSLARERDHSVLLVDGDVIKPKITRAVGLRDHLGLMDVLADEGLALQRTIVDTDIPGLSIMPAGQRSEVTTELLSSRRMTWLIEELAADPARIVVFDSSPLLATSESQALALNMGQIVVVVKAAFTERRAVEAALSLISAPERSISLVLNQSRKTHGDAYAGYYGMYYGGEDGSFSS